LITINKSTLTGGWILAVGDPIIYDFPFCGDNPVINGEGTGISLFCLLLFLGWKLSLLEFVYVFFYKNVGPRAR
jgi:hypothetical protein